MIGLLTRRESSGARPWVYYCPISMLSLGGAGREIIYFKVYKSQLPVIEQAVETAGFMLGNDKSRGYCLEMICADFLAGASLESGEVKSPNVACPHGSGLATAHQAPDAKPNS